jgi:hypothetical protein
MKKQTKKQILTIIFLLLGLIWFFGFTEKGQDLIDSDDDVVDSDEYHANQIKQDLINLVNEELYDIQQCGSFELNNIYANCIFDETAEAILTLRELKQSNEFTSEEVEFIDQTIEDLDLQANTILLAIQEEDEITGRDADSNLDSAVDDFIVTSWEMVDPSPLTYQLFCSLNTIPNWLTGGLFPMSESCQKRNYCGTFLFFFDGSCEVYE